jgi:multiple sugar transport system permease protein
MGISKTYYEAAKVDGAGTISQFFRITLPLLKPTIILVLFLSVTGSLQYYDLISNLTGGGPNNASTTLVVYAYSLCFGSSNAGYAMAISNILFLIVLVVALMQSGLMRREVSEI